MSRAGLDEPGLTPIVPEDVQALDSVAHIRELQEVGQAVAARDVRIEHFAKFLS
ncbi:MAG: hypothetical protein WBV94_35000 [Blastocatellia bacterium]